MCELVKKKMEKCLIKSESVQQVIKVNDGHCCDQTT